MEGYIKTCDEKKLPQLDRDIDLDRFKPVGTMMPVQRVPEGAQGRRVGRNKPMSHAERELHDYILCAQHSPDVYPLHETWARYGECPECGDTHAVVQPDDYLCVLCRYA